MSTTHPAIKLRDPVGLRKGRSLDDLVHEEMTAKAYKHDLRQAQLELLTWQRRLTETKNNIIVVMEGPDAAGKGGAIKRLLERLDPRLVRVYSTVKPTTEEYGRHYLWRFWSRLPPYGWIGVFDRSWYGRVLVERVEGFCEPAEWKRAYREINEFERQLLDDGTILVKLYLFITKSEQLARFKSREADPYKHWKISDEDWRNRRHWKENMEAAEDMLFKTSTERAPWHVIGANYKWHTRVKTVSTVVEAIKQVQAAGFGTMRHVACVLIAGLLLAGCDRQAQTREAIELGDKRAKLGAYAEAVRAYESALDGTAKSADVHYKIAVLYDGKLKRPLDAIHHYERYLELTPNGGRAKEAKLARGECEKLLHLSMKAGGFMTTVEGARLRNENEELRKIIAELRSPKPTPGPRVPNPSSSDPLPAGASTHVVQKGETLASIALKYYHNRAQAHRIKDANLNQLGGKDIIKPGQTLIIPAPPAKKRP